MAEKAKPVYKFGPFRIAGADGLLTHNGRAIRLTPKSFELLVFMVENRGRLLDKETLLTSVWPDTFVEESNLTKNVFLLRRCLGKREDGRPYIETFPRRGYRFDADVRVEAITELPDPTRALRDDTPDTELGILVGRDHELRMLEALMEHTTRGNGKIVLFIGEAGIGKTALAESFLASVRRRYPDTLIAKGICVEQYGAGEAYLPFLEALNLLVTTYTREGVLAPLGVNAPTWCLHLPAAVSSAAERERMHYETIGATKERMLREMGDFLSVITCETPVVLLLEDLHWADTSSADLLRSLGQRISTERLLVMGTYRPEDLEIKNHSLRNYARELVAHGVCEEIPLEALNRGDIVAYLDTRFSPNDFPAEMAALIAQKTEGYPLFVSGLAELLIQRGDIAWRDGCWTLTRRPAEFAFEVPRTVVSIIRNRLDRLDDRDRRALEYATIEGEEFSSRILSALLETEEITVEEQMDRLEKVHRLVRRLDQEELPDGSLAIRYRFAHALYQNTLYEGLVPGRRVALHRRAGEELLRLHAGQESHVAAQLAMHFEHARDFSRAVQYLLDVGDNASHLYDNTAALLHYSRH